jgi:thiosulfate/3-mercaptopyruvate sulfurtransferase
MHTTVVSTDVLAAHLDGSWAIVDCRFDLQHENSGREAYLAAHVPTAVYAHLGRDLAGVPTGTNGRHPLPAVTSLARVFGALGIASGTQVVAYDQDAGMYASRLWWLLRYLGHDAVAVLDGGWAKWESEGRPARGGVESRPPSTFVPRPRPERLADVGDVAAASRDGSALLVDARAPERFTGRVETIDRLAGHIPGAVNAFFRLNLGADGTLLPADVLRQRYHALLGSRPPGQAIMYCGSGVTACHNLLAMEHAGLGGARLYPGSWSEWSADPTRPIATEE